MEEYFKEEIRNCKKWKFKVKKLSELLYEMNKSRQYNQQTEPSQCKSEVLSKVWVKCYVFTKTWIETGAIIAQHLHLKINSGCHDRENLFEETISEIIL